MSSNKSAMQSALLKPRPTQTPATPQAATPDEETARGAGRPRELEHPEKVTVILERRHAAFLAQYMATLRARGVKVQRAEIIRALVDALERGDITLPW